MVIIWELEFVTKPAADSPISLHRIPHYGQMDFALVGESDLHSRAITVVIWRAGDYWISCLEDREGLLKCLAPPAFDVVPKYCGCGAQGLQGLIYTAERFPIFVVIVEYNIPDPSTANPFYIGTKFSNPGLPAQSKGKQKEQPLWLRNILLRRIPIYGTRQAFNAVVDATILVQCKFSRCIQLAD
jgi:hypothetical protein